MNFKYRLIVATLVVLVVAATVNAAPKMEDIIGRLRSRITKMVDKMNLNKRLGEVIGQVQNISRNIDNVSNCFVPEVNGKELNIFDDGLNFTSVVDFYYEVFPSNSITDKSIMSLLNSTKEIVERCLNNSAKNATVRYGYTEMSDMSLEELSSVKGLRLDEYFDNDNNTDGRSKRLTGKDNECIPENDTEVPESFDWRDEGVVTPVKNQGRCGSCWAFASLAAIESAYLLAGRTDDPDFDLAEQMLLSCTRGNGCYGGTSYRAFDFVSANFATDEDAMPYRGRNGRCPRRLGRLPEAAVIDDFCIRSKFRYTRSAKKEELTDDDLMKSLVEFGPLYVGVDSNPLISRNYRGGVMDDDSCTTDINHAVLLVGYTPDAWIIKNSWGQRWGEDGYFRLARGKNMCGINTEIAFPILN